MESLFKHRDAVHARCKFVVHSSAQTFFLLPIINFQTDIDRKDEGEGSFRSPSILDQTSARRMERRREEIPKRLKFPPWAIDLREQRIHDR